VQEGLPSAIHRALDKQALCRVLQKQTLGKIIALGKREKKHSANIFQKVFAECQF